MGEIPALYSLGWMGAAMQEDRACAAAVQAPTALGLDRCARLRAAGSATKPGQ